MRRSLILLLIICLPLLSFGNNNASSFTLRGLVMDAVTGETLPGATIYVTDNGRGTTSNMDGEFELRLAAGSYLLKVTYVGYESISINVDLAQNKQLQIELKPAEEMLSEVVVSGRRAGEQVESTEMGVVRLQSQAIGRIPAMMGEVDLINAIQMLPGVQSVGEGASGFNVRGGGIDQNLILMDEATVYNASHLMGFFSVFNNDVVENLELHKGNIPARHGGRLSSLLNVHMKEGDMQNYSGTGGIGSISSRFMMEGPIVKDKVSFVAAGRRSYADLFIPLAGNPDIQGNKLYFYDLNLKLNAVIDDNNRLQFSTYHGKDFFRMGQDAPFTMDWGNTTYTLRWGNIINEKLLVNTHFIYTGYNYSLMQEGDDNASFIWEAGNQDVGLRTDLSWFPNENNNISAGFSSIYHRFDPGMLRGLNENNFIGSVGSTTSDALSHALYLSNDQQIDDRWSLDYGLRLSVFQSMGPATVYNFDDNHNYIDSTVYGRGDIYNTWSGLEPRLGVRYAINDISSLKASYNRNFQYLHLASFSDGGNPLDIWVPSSKRIKPQIGNQFSLGYFRNLQAKSTVLEGSVEVFYKKMDNQIDFKENAWLMLNPKIEGEFRFGDARAYGAEFLLKKDEGIFTGWISYTWSRAERQIEGVNNSNIYPASYDRPHNLSIVLNYQLSHRVSLSANWVYTTGAPVTLPAGRYEFGNQYVPVYTERNAYRLPDYHRLDLGATIKTKNSTNRNFYGEWNISIYNAYYRKNTWMLEFSPDSNVPGKLDAYKVYLFPILPSVTYNFYF